MTGTIVILGAAGFIGRHLSETFARTGATVVAATRAPAMFSHPGIRNAVAAYDNAGDFARVIADAESVIHAASSTTPGSTAAKPQLEGNLRTTLGLIEALQDARGTRVVFLSSGGTLYGDRELPAREDDPLRPRSYHGAGKAAAEHFLHAWATQYAGTAILLRPSNVYGPGQPARRGFGIIPAAFDCALHGLPLTLWGDGSAVRDYLFVDDLVSLCASSLATPMAPGAHVFNAASGEAVALDTLLDRIEAATGRTLQRQFTPARAVDVRSITVDTSAARSTFGWAPATTLEEGLRRTWQWFSNQA
jgi:UDP-glucose 4-epimerase